MKYQSLIGEIKNAPTKENRKHSLRKRGKNKKKRKKEPTRKKILARN